MQQDFGGLGGQFLMVGTSPIHQPVSSKNRSHTAAPRPPGRRGRQCWRPKRRDGSSGLTLTPTLEPVLSRPPRTSQSPPSSSDLPPPPQSSSPLPQYSVPSSSGKSSLLPPTGLQGPERCLTGLETLSQSCQDHFQAPRPCFPRQHCLIPEVGV